MAKQKCAAEVGSMSLSGRFSPIKQCTKYASLVESFTVDGKTYVKAYCSRHRSNPEQMSPSVNFKVEAI
jgi:hypothetical protein